jgi:hypothetical protein
LGRITDKPETAPAKIEGDLAGWERPKGIARLRRFLAQTGNCSSSSTTRIMKEYEAAFRNGGHKCIPRRKPLKFN